MKKTKLFTLLLATFIFAACGSNDHGHEHAEEQDHETESAEGETESTETENQSPKVLQMPDGATAFALDATISNVEWTGEKATGATHNGTIALSDGQLFVADGTLAGGNLSLDMASIANSDLEGELKQKLEGHLKSDAFFDVANHPSAKLEITKIETLQGDANHTHTITANLTIKGITNSVSFPAFVTTSESQLTANGTAVFNRANYNVKYGSGSFFDNLGDDLINDDVSIKFNITANAQQS